MPVLSADFLANVPIFHGTTEEERNQLLQAMTRETFYEGATIIREGKASRGLHLIVEGKAKVVLEVHGFDNPAVDEGASPIVDEARLATLEIGDVFGETSFFHGGDHSATVLAAAKVELLTLPAEEFEKLVARQSTVAYKIALNAVQILAARVQQADKMIAELILSQHDAAMRSVWYANRLGLYSSLEHEPRFRNM